ncbi:unnamed protein product [Discosporangium mesarthrocarpum]
MALALDYLHSNRKLHRVREGTPSADGDAHRPPFSAVLDQISCSCFKGIFEICCLEPLGITVVGDTIEKQCNHDTPLLYILSVRLRTLMSWNLTHHHFTVVRLGLTWFEFSQDVYVTGRCIWFRVLWI